ncbi:ImmA/IrrE family metallo-endopeptidase, partial [bacterium]|nr:ImmA/IrrE family metallo-endopeptidase [bacterium]
AGAAQTGGQGGGHLRQRHDEDYGGDDMSEPIPVNPDVLRWARETAGFSIKDVVTRINRKRVTAGTIAAWERGAESPTYPQLERLAYEIYKRPLALFFFPEPPQEESPKQSFRTLPEYEISRIPPRLRYLIRQAKVMQIDLAELNDKVNPASRQILQDLRFNPDVAVDEMTVKVRKYLNIELNRQKSWKSTDEAFKTWRNALEEHGVFVFKEAFKEDAFSGFCLYDEQFPIIYVNNSKSDTRQIFTLFHELAHLLLGTGGIDTRLDEYINLLTGDDRKIEILCNRFAGGFLVPDDDFGRIISGIRIEEKSIQYLAMQYHVSHEVILRKLLDRGIIDQSFYKKQVEQWAKGAPTKSGSGGNYYARKGVYLGEYFLGMAFSRYYQNRISIDQLANYLGVKVKNVAGMESLLFKREATV